jgi:hypothetical protein
MGGSGINIIETKQDQKKSQFKKKIVIFRCTDWQEPFNNVLSRSFFG